MSRLSELIQKIALLLVISFVSGYLCFVITLLFDRDVGGALVAPFLAALGTVMGLIIAIVIIRRRFD
jgi:hypothetical protein